MTLLSLTSRSSIDRALFGKSCRFNSRQGWALGFFYFSHASCHVDRFTLHSKHSISKIRPTSLFSATSWKKAGELSGNINLTDSSEKGETVWNSPTYMLFASWEVRIMKNCDRGLENAARGRRPRAAFSRPRSQFFTIRTDLSR